MDKASIKRELKRVGDKVQRAKWNLTHSNAERVSATVQEPEGDNAEQLDRSKGDADTCSGEV